MHADATTSTLRSPEHQVSGQARNPEALNLEALGWRLLLLGTQPTRAPATLVCSEITSERPPAETIVDAGFDRIDRHGVASDKGAAVTAEIEVVVLDLRTPVVPEGIFGPDADNPAACCPAGRAAEAERRVDADANVGPGPAHLAIDKPIIESVTEPRGQRGKRVPVEVGRDRAGKGADRQEVVFYSRP